MIKRYREINGQVYYECETCPETIETNELRPPDYEDWANWAEMAGDNL